MKKPDVAKAKLHQFELEELACHIAGLNYDEVDADSATIEGALYDKYGLDLDGFYEIVAVLLPMIDVGSSPLTGARFKGFAVDQQWLAKVEIPK